MNKIAYYAVKYKLLFLYSLLVISFFAILCSAALYQSKQSVVRQARVDAKNISYGLEQNIQSSFKKVDLALISISKLTKANLLTKKVYQDEKFKILQLYKEKISEVSAFRMTDNHGKVIYSTESNQPSNLDVGDREYFKFHQSNLNSDLFISKPILSKVDGRQIITLSRRLEADANKFVGIVYAVISMDHFRELINSIEVGPEGNISIISLIEGAILYRFPEEYNTLGLKIWLHPEAMDLISSQKISGEWEQYSRIDQMKKTFGLRINYMYGYIISTGLAENDYLEQWSFTFYAGLAVFVVFIFSLIFALAKYILSQEQVEKQKNQMNINARKVAVGRIASGVAHEINNPLAIIKGKSEIARLLLSELKDDRPEIINQLLDIEKTVGRIAKIVRGMQILGQQREEEHSVNNLSEIIGSALDILSQKMADYKIVMEVEQSPTVAVYCNRSDIIEVFIHLISNSIDAVKSLDEKWIRIAVKPETDNVLIVVTDSGKGILKKEMASIMDPFFTTKPPGSGIGLGLAVTDAILRNHGGILLHNRDSIHTQFIIQIRTGSARQEKSA